MDQFFTYFRRYFVYINIALILLLAFTCATVTNSFVGRELDSRITEIRDRIDAAAQQIIAKNEDDSKSGGRNSRRGKPSANETLASYIGPIGDRNLFDAEVSAAKPMASEITAKDAELSVLNVKLEGTIVAEQQEYSFAIITNKKTRETDVYQIGDIIMGAAKVIKINRNEVIVDNNGKTEVLFVFEEQAEILDEPADDKPAEGGELADGENVAMVGEDEYEISAEVFANLDTNMSQLMTQARIVPYFKKGKIDGYKVFAIKKDSLYEKIGLNNGDIIRRVNGMDISSPDKALQMMTQLKNETSFRIDLSRKGEQRTFSYSVR